MLLTFLRSQKLLLEAEIKARRNFCLNNAQLAEADIKANILKEVIRQIEQIEKHGML